MNKFFRMTAMISGLAILSAETVLADGTVKGGDAQPAVTPAAAQTAVNPSSSSGRGPRSKSKMSKKKTAPAKAAKEKYVWVCPMGDYTGDKPGKCPNCQMDLVKQKVADPKPAGEKTDKKM